MLLLCLAPHVDAAFERIYAYVQDDATRKHPTPGLALALLAPTGEPTTPLRVAFHPDAPLRHNRLVTLEAAPGQGAAGSPLVMDDRVADFLLGIHRLDDRLAHVLQPLPPPLIAEAPLDLADRLANAVALAAEAGALPLVNLWGSPGAGKRAVASALGQRLGLHAHALEARHIPGDPRERHELAQRLAREALLGGVIAYVDATSVEPADASATERVNDLANRVGGILLLGSRERWPLDREVLAVEVPPLDARDRVALWTQALSDEKGALREAIEAVVEQFPLGPSAIARAAAAARLHAALRAPGTDAAPAAGDLWAACRDQPGASLDGLAQRIVPRNTWDDIVLPEDASLHLRELASQVRHRRLVYGTWGFGRRMSRGRGLTALFAGPSGTGKTLAAEILANHLQLDLYRIDLSSVVDKYIGETEKNLRRVFDAAEASGAILFFDEADALFGKRTEVKDSHDRYANIEVNYLLQRMEEYGGLAILATNRKSSLDGAFLRRLRFLVDFPFPDPESRRRIWEKAFPPETPLEGIDPGALARLEIPGGNIRNIALNAAFLAAAEGAPVRTNHVMAAARREYAKMEKMITPTEFGPYARRGTR